MRNLFLKLVTGMMHATWRWTRGLTMGVQCCLIDEDGKVVLVRHGYRPGWHFPGGGVERGETARVALERELEEEVGVALHAPPDLFSVYGNFKHFRGDHIVLFVSRDWTQQRTPQPNFEIADIERFDPDDLPADIHPPTRARLEEIFQGRPAAHDWHVNPLS